MREATPLLEIEQLHFRWPGSAMDCLDIPHFALHAGEKVFLRGRSGSGKTTLLSLIAGLLRPASGNIRLLQHAVHRMSGAQRDRFRADNLGYIFQQFNLIPYLSVLDNVVLSCRFSPRRMEHIRQTTTGLREAATSLLGHLQLADAAMLDQPAHSLSVGQQQRVAAARALMGAPPLIIADEPTSALDADTRLRFIDLLQRVCEENNSALLFVSHDAQLQSCFDRSVDLADINRATQRIL